MKSPLSAAAPAAAVFRNRNYISLMASQLVSNLGDWLYLIALLTVVGFKWNATSWEVTLMMLCMVIPVLVGGPLSGVLADRMERKKLMVLSDLARVIIMAAFLAAGTLWQVYALLLVKGIFDTLFSPAKNGKLKEIVPKEQLEQAISISATIEQGSKIIGPAIGGFLYAAFGDNACFMINAVCFAVSALFLLKVPGKHQLVTNKPSQNAQNPAAVNNGAPANAKKRSVMADLAEGLRIIAGIPVIAYGLMVLGIVLLVLQIADSQVVVLFRGIEGLPHGLLGYCIALSGAGTLLATLSIRFLKWPPLTKMAAGGAIMGVVFSAASLLAAHGPYNGVGYFLLAACFMVAGFGAGMTFLPFQITVQQHTPESLTGRVFGTVSSVTSSAVLLGPLLGGLLVTAYGVTTAFLLSGSIMAGIGILLLLFSRRIANSPGMHRSPTAAEAVSKM
ncbi:MFS transporter [Paenibacillus protaetiae]|uniref:MFS transporter n=1 Tax=Paenibacillus protaetiae TaxID=2509456 RepID=A0A4P6F1A4_9BACL|nr:MFS transporter [Paenibacillus protaetiae]QAY67899.1 MFS transporter [Paenibacillus protaetiae]